MIRNGSAVQKVHVKLQIGLIIKAVITIGIEIMALRLLLTVVL